MRTHDNLGFFWNFILDRINRILIVNDSLEGLETAVSKAALLEHYTGSEVEVAETIWDSIEDENLPDETKQELIDVFKKAELKTLQEALEPFADKIAFPSAQVLWNRRSDDAIAEEIAARDIDLLIKPASRRGLQDYLHAPLDWRLIRQSTCAVLISQSEEWSVGGHVLAALDVTNEKHEALNREVVATSQFMAKVLDATLHLLSVYPDLGQSVSERQVAMDYVGLKEDMRAAREEALADLAAGIDDVQVETHVEEGKPAKLIAHLAETLPATVTVLGTSARTGLGKWILGNTAESTLPRLGRDVLAVKSAEQT